MNFLQKYLDDTIRAIEFITRMNLNTFISVKKIRKFFHIEPSHHVEINFYWRSLQDLERKGILECLGTYKPKRYRVINYFKLFDLVYHVYQKEVGLI